MTADWTFFSFKKAYFLNLNTVNFNLEVTLKFCVTKMEFFKKILCSFVHKGAQ